MKDQEYESTVVVSEHDIITANKVHVQGWKLWWSSTSGCTRYWHPAEANLASILELNTRSSFFPSRLGKCHFQLPATSPNKGYGRNRQLVHLLRETKQTVATDDEEAVAWKLVSQQLAEEGDMQASPRVQINEAVHREAELVFETPTQEKRHVCFIPSSKKMDSKEPS
jgi:hypothetical protein